MFYSLKLQENFIFLFRFFPLMKKKIIMTTLWLKSMTLAGTKTSKRITNNIKKILPHASACLCFHFSVCLLKLLCGSSAWLLNHKKLQKNKELNASLHIIISFRHHKNVYTYIFHRIRRQS